MLKHVTKHLKVSNWVIGKVIKEEITKKGIYFRSESNALKTLASNGESKDKIFREAVNSTMIFNSSEKAKFVY